MNQADTPRPYGRHAGTGPGSGVSGADPLGLGIPAQTSLELVIGRHGPVAPAQAARIGLAVLDQLMSVHRHGMAHGDVRPGSVLMGPQDRVVLAGPSLRSPVFTAPEGVTGPVADLWSLGATLFTAVEGRPPAPGASLQNAGPLAPILVGLLAGDPALRPDPGVLRDGLLAVSQDRPPSFPALPAPPSPSGPPSPSVPGSASPLPPSDSEPGRALPGPPTPVPQSPRAAAPLQAPPFTSQDPGTAPPFPPGAAGAAQPFTSQDPGTAPPFPPGAAGAAQPGSPEPTVPFRVQPSIATAPGASPPPSGPTASGPTASGRTAPSAPMAPPALPPALPSAIPSAPADTAAPAGPVPPAPADSAPPGPPDGAPPARRDLSSTEDSGPAPAVPSTAGRPGGVLVPRSIVALTGVLMAGMAVTIGILLVPVLSGSAEDESTDPGARGRFTAAPRACGLLTDAQAGELVPGFRSSEVEPAECNWLNSADWRKPGTEKFDLRVRLVAQKQDGSEVRRAQEYLAGRKQDTRDQSERATPAPLPPQDLKGLGEEAFITGGYGPSKLYGGSYKVTVVFRVSNLVAEVEYERGGVKEDADGRVAENGAKVARWIAEALRARG
ncbi:hypothetical protein [Planomonospora sp. ID82291]|uniref:hypothetical protein n=1 Tax=Planomonospora sp. ID82291 TaxID=2738136 RepID=UPI0018C3F94C|nr:hypothetical protein [Planomonospora sp. ID82291]MBG0813201.1 hypothetical protein [Planomonospora sp. ID82291]